MEEKQRVKQEVAVENERVDKQTKKQLFAEILRFLIVGGIATIADYFIAYAFIHWILPEKIVGATWSLIVSTAMGFLVGLIVNWILSITFVFKQVKDKEKSTSNKSLLIFTVIGLIGLAITQVGMLLGEKILPSFKLFSSVTFLGEEWKWWLSKVVMTCIVLVWNYLGRKILIFK